MIFKKDDMVYCIDYHYIMGDKNSKIFNTLHYDVPYKIFDIYEYQIILSDQKYIYKKERFITEEQYLLRQRIGKIKHLKELFN